MKRKSWISIVCGGLLLIALAMPAAAADGGSVPPFTLLERVLSWIESWVPPGAPSPGFDRETAADSEDDAPDEPLGTTSSYCDACNNDGEFTSVIDPDG